MAPRFLAPSRRARARRPLPELERERAETSAAPKNLRVRSEAMSYKHTVEKLGDYRRQIDALRQNNMGQS